MGNSCESSERRRVGHRAIVQAQHGLVLSCDRKKTLRAICATECGLYCKFLYRRFVWLIVVLPLAACTSGTWVVVHMTATSGLVLANLQLTVGIEGHASREVAIAALPDDRQVLMPDRVQQLTATLTGTIAGQPFSVRGATESVVHQKRTLNLYVNAVSPPDLGTARDLAVSDLTTNDLVPLPPLALVNTVPLPETNKQVSTTVNLNGGELVLLAVYWNNNTATMTVSDTAQNTWRMGPIYSNPVTTCSASNGTQLQFWVSENSKPGMTTISAVESTDVNTMGAFLLIYSGVALSSAEEVRSGGVATMATMTMEIPPLKTTGAEDLIVAAFADALPNGVMQEGAGFRADSVDKTFSAMIEDAVGVGPGVHPVRATLPTGDSDSCWVGAAVAFRRR
jgi:hypothetical protein